MGVRLHELSNLLKAAFLIRREETLFSVAKQSNEIVNCQRPLGIKYILIERIEGVPTLDNIQCLIPFSSQPEHKTINCFPNLRGYLRNHIVPNLDVMSVDDAGIYPDKMAPASAEYTTTISGPLPGPSRSRATISAVWITTIARLRPVRRL